MEMDKEEKCEHEFFPVSSAKGMLCGVEGDVYVNFVIFECASCGKIGYIEADDFDDEA